MSTIENCVLCGWAAATWASGCPPPPGSPPAVRPATRECLKPVSRAPIVIAVHCARQLLQFDILPHFTTNVLHMIITDLPVVRSGYEEKKFLLTTFEHLNKSLQILRNLGHCEHVKKHHTEKP
ncbi:Protein of unknown function [Gryllus bimaculatus]|nr:Protein of unknown function [Gryllus bimaculatus]